MSLYRFHPKVTSGMVKIAEGVYLSRNDPEFYEKALRYKPHDPELLAGLARKRKLQQSAERTATPSTKNPSGSAAQVLPIQKERVPERLTSIPSLAQPAAAARAIPQQRSTDSVQPASVALWTALLLLLLAGVLLLLVLVFGKFMFERNEFHYHYNTSGTASVGGTTVPGTTERLFSNGGRALTLLSAADRDEYIRTAVLMQGLEFYRAKLGTYPEELASLMGGAPDNIVSLNPTELRYNREGQGYTLSSSSWVEPAFPVGGLELQFYPEVNQLGLWLEGSLLAIYPVASGSEGNEIPFHSSEVTARVVEPNGGSGAFGTRGLVLRDGYAIHGTNQRDSIGKKVSKGCLRMYNEDLETLYSYVPLGTPFRQVSGTPNQAPLFPEGLPELGTGDISKERTPGVIYQWRD